MSIFVERKNYKPFEYHRITDPLIDAMWAGHWTHNEFTFKSDVHDFKTVLTPEEREVITRAILMISQVEVSVKSYWSNISKLLPKPEIADMGSVFGGVEVIHSRAYSEILAKLKMEKRFEELLGEEVIQNRTEYLRKYVNKIYKNDHKNILYSLVLFTLFTENVSLFSQFYLILGFNRFQNILKDISNVVAYTSKEEQLHAQGGTLLINTITKEHPELFDEEFQNKIIEEVQEALHSERKIVQWILQGYQNDFLTEEILMEYIKGRMNTSLKDIGIKFQFPINKELIEKTTWMDEEIFGSAMVDFFNKKPIDYTKKTKSFEANELF